MDAARIVGAYYHGKSALYKEEHTGNYLLILSPGQMTQDDFNKVGNILSEYGQLLKNTSFSQSYLEEHYTAMIRTNALNALCGENNF